jgi:multicomponent Na+:H+ antiporter subunit B
VGEGMRRIIELAVILSLILGVSVLLVLAASILIPGVEVRQLAFFYLYTTINPWFQNYTVNSPEAVTAIVWDYRGLDTLFETSVFYLALIAGLALARGLFSETPQGSFNEKTHGLTTIVKTVTRVTAPMIIAVGASIGLHGHLTPGGGFQGGATIAVIPLVFIVVYSTLFLIARGVTSNKMLVLRSIGLLGIGFTTIATFLIGLAIGRFAYVFQNMPKPGAVVGLPADINGALISGTLWFFNLFEMIAVAAGFTIAFIILLLAGRGGSGGR